MIALVWDELWRALVLAISLTLAALPAQESPKPESPKTAPEYEDTFSGPIQHFTEEKITVSRSILGKSESRTFWIKPDTKIEGKLKVNAKVTVGFVTADDGDVARLIVVRPQKK